MKIQTFYDEFTATLTYIVYDEQTQDALIIDPVLNYEPQASKISIESLEKALQFLLDNHLKLHFVLETHAHADHLSCARFIKDHNPDCQIGIGENITKVQKTFQALYNLKDAKTDGSQFDVLFEDQKTYNAGALEFKVFFTPGHTEACASYLFNNEAIFTGDTLFMPDYGCGRCDFPGGDAKALYHSIHDVLYSLPDQTKVFVGHDYKPNGRKLKFESTIYEQKAKNIQLPFDRSQDNFVEFRIQRDKTLNAPKLLWPSIQINVYGAHLPTPEDNGKRYLKIPLN